MAAKKQPSPKKVEADQKKYAQLLDECIEHEKDSAAWLQNLNDTWDEKESMLIVRLEDQASKKTKAKVFDPRLSTIVFERSARVMAQSPKGKAFAVSKDDLGKNMLMNMLLDYYRNNANEQFSHLIKLRMWDLYSLVYGSMFALVPWRVNQRNGYIGPELLILPIRDVRPQPGVKNVGEMDWFQVRNTTSIDWLRDQDRDTWMNIDELEKQLKDAKSKGEGAKFHDSKKTSYVERTYYPNVRGDAVFPRVELYTEYRGDMWITYAPNQFDEKTGKPLILRVVRDAYPEGMLPIVGKHAFPLIDSPIGLGEFERGKSLQYALNSLVNLYMDGVKYSIFPPLAIDPNSVVPSSIKWGAGERWYMNNPNRDVQPVKLSPQGIETFTSTYNFMLSALYTQAGSTNVGQAADEQASLGKTPQALKLYAASESARDEWDRFMMEEAIKEVYNRWIALSVEKQETDVELRLFKSDIEEIHKMYPDIKDLAEIDAPESETEEAEPTLKDMMRRRMTVFGSGDRGNIKVNKRMIEAKYDYELETGSTVKTDLTREQDNVTTILKAVIENPVIIQSLQQQGKTVDVGELFKRWLVGSGMKDWDKVIIDHKVDAAGASAGGGIATPGAEVVPPQTAPVPGNTEPSATVPGAGAVPSEATPQFQDPQIAEAAMQILGGMGGVPPTGA